MRSGLLPTGFRPAQRLLESLAASKRLDEQLGRLAATASDAIARGDREQAVLLHAELATALRQQILNDWRERLGGRPPGA